LIGANARAMISAKPLKLSSVDVKTIDQINREYFAKKLSEKYQKFNKNTPFNNLPPSVQTAITSVAFQYGINLEKACPKFWEAAVTEDFKKMLEILRDFKDKYPTRRKKEANYMEKGLKETDDNAMSLETLLNLISEKHSEEQKKLQEEYNAYSKSLIDNAPEIEVSRREISRSKIGETVNGNTITEHWKILYEITMRKDLRGIEQKMENKRNALNELLKKSKGETISNLIASAMFAQAKKPMTFVGGAKPK